MDAITAAIAYRQRGFFPVPVPPGAKGPTQTGWNRLRIEADDIPQHFTDGDNVGLLLGEPSGWLVDVDLDCEEAIELAEHYLPPTNAITGRDGSPRSHWWYFATDCKTARFRDAKLTNGAATTVELRSTGLQTLVGPSRHPTGAIYELLQGEPATVSADELRAGVERLHEAVLRVRGHQATDEPQTEKPTDAALDDLSPGSDYSRRGDVAGLLRRHGWSLISGDNSGDTKWRRPGKPSGISATLFADQTFYCFSSSVPELEPDRSYTPFGLFAALEHGGDFSAATVALAADGYGQQLAPGVDISGIVNGLGKNCGTHTDGSAVAVLPDETIPPKTMSSPGEFPSHLYDVPGFIGEVASYANSTAFRRQPQLALWGAICLQAVLAARKIRDIYGGRTNLYVIAMAKSGKGKDHARRVNRRILDAAGLLHLDGPEDIASDSGLLRVLKDQPGLLMHMDEIGRILTAIRGAGEQRGWLYSIATQLMRLYSSADSTFTGKAYADGRDNAINQPCLTIFGTTVEESFWGSMTSEAIGSGFLPRLIPVLGNEHSPFEDAPVVDPPSSVVRHACEWGEFNPSGGNLAAINPEPQVVEYTTEARRMLFERRQHWDKVGDEADEWQPLWARTGEKACRLALIYAASRGIENLRIDTPAVEWACEVADYTTRLF